MNRYLILFLFTLSLSAGVNQRDQVARNAKDLMTTIDRLEEYTGYAASLPIANYAHEYGHKIALDEIGIDAKIGLNAFSGHVDFEILPEQEQYMTRNYGAGLEIDQLIASYGLENIRNKKATGSDYTSAVRNHAMLIYHYHIGGDGQKYLKHVGEKSKFKMSLFTQALNYSQFFDLPVSFGNRTHLTHEGIVNYYDVFYEGLQLTHLKDGFGVAYTHDFITLSYIQHKSEYDMSLTFKHHYYLDLFFNVGYKNKGIFIGKAEEDGIYFSASIAF